MRENYPNNAPPYNNYYDNRRYETDTRQNTVTYDQNVQYIDADTGKSAINTCARIVLLIFVALFLAAGLALGIVSNILESWWTYEEETGGKKLQIGLWKACLRETENSEFTCKDYDEGDENNKSKYEDIEVLQYCMIVGTAVCGVALLLLIASAIFRKAKVFRILLYIIAFLSLASVALLCVVVGYALEITKVGDVKPKWFGDQHKDEELDRGTMLYIACGAAGCVGMALVINGVFLFISDDVIDSRGEDKEEETPGHVRSYSFDYGQSHVVEREISQRGKQLVNRENNGFFLQNMNNVNENPKYKSPQFYEFGKSNFQNENDKNRQNKNKILDYHDAYRNDLDAYSYPNNNYDDLSYSYNDDLYRSYDDQYRNFNYDEVDGRRKKSHRHSRIVSQPYMSYGQVHEDRSLNLPRDSRRVVTPLSYSTEPRTGKSRPSSKNQQVQQQQYPLRPVVAQPQLNGGLYYKKTRNTPDYPDSNPPLPVYRSNTDPNLIRLNNKRDGYDKYFDSPY